MQHHLFKMSLLDQSVHTEALEKQTKKLFDTQKEALDTHQSCNLIGGNLRKLNLCCTKRYAEKLSEFTSPLMVPVFD